MHKLCFSPCECLSLHLLPFIFSLFLATAQQQRVQQIPPGSLGCRSYQVSSAVTSIGGLYLTTQQCSSPEAPAMACPAFVQTKPDYFSTRSDERTHKQRNNNTTVEEKAHLKQQKKYLYPSTECEPLHLVTKFANTTCFNPLIKGSFIQIPFPTFSYF